MPNNTKDKEKNALIARTAATNSVALAINIGIPLPGCGHKKVPYSKTNGSAAANHHQNLNQQIHGHILLVIHVR